MSYQVCFISLGGIHTNAQVI